MSRSYRLTTPLENTCKKFIAILEQDGLPLGTAILDKKEAMQDVIDAWLSGRNVKAIPGVSPNEP